MYTNSRGNEVHLLKQLWVELPTICPKCHQAELEYLHKKVEKSNLDQKCPAREETYCTIDMLGELPDS